VPVLTCDVDQLVSDQWDLSIRRILPFIDGINFVKKLAILADMDIDIARDCIRQLASHKLVAIIDIFQFSNVYVATPDIRNLFSDRKMQRACLRYIAVSESKLPPFREVFRLYCNLRRGERWSAKCQTHPLIVDRVIDPHRFIVFGRVNGLIRRVHRYPVGKIQSTKTVDSSSGNDNKDGTLTHDMRFHLEAMMDGTYSFDAISCELGFSYSQLESIMRSEIGCIIVHK
jgi:nitrogen permease regulator 2